MSLDFRDLDDGFDELALQDPAVIFKPRPKVGDDPAFSGGGKGDRSSAFTYNIPPRILYSQSIQSPTKDSASHQLDLGGNGSNWRRSEWSPARPFAQSRLAAKSYKSSPAVTDSRTRQASNEINSFSDFARSSYSARSANDEILDGAEVEDNGVYNNVVRNSPRSRISTGVSVDSRVMLDDRLLINSASIISAQSRSSTPIVAASRQPVQSRTLSEARIQTEQLLNSQSSLIPLDAGPTSVLQDVEVQQTDDAILWELSRTNKQLSDAREEIANLRHEVSEERKQRRDLHERVKLIEQKFAALRSVLVLETAD